MTDASRPAPRIAMWSGPRNISTALMRSWGSRADTAVVDEPLYAHYLAETGRAHPGREEIIDRYETDWRTVAERITGPVPDGASIYYQKHMAHHLLPTMDWGWTTQLRNAFLIREPGEMLTSLIEFLPEPTLSDTGLPQQWRLFQHLRTQRGEPPPVITARGVLTAPRPTLHALCEALGVPFRPSMLSWAPGPRETDGLWGQYWYDAVYESTGFRPYEPKDESVPARLRELHEECRAFYDKLYAHRLCS
ncbi:MAG: HAD family hydrolase [Salinibacter sp.]